MEEKKMRSVEIKVWTESLNSVDITPVSLEYAKDSFGEKPDNLYNDFKNTKSTFFCSDNNDAILTVYDSDNDIKINQLPQILLNDINEYKGFNKEELMAELGEDTENDLLEHEEYYVWKLTKNANLDDVYLFSEFWHEVIEDDAWLMKYVQMENKRYCEEIGEDASFVECGSFGKAMLRYRIEIPEDEKFDIDKLHFISEMDWWDNDPYIDEFSEAFDGYDVLMMVVEYDGKFYPLEDYDISPGWKKYSGGRFFDTELNEI